MSLYEPEKNYGAAIKVEDLDVDKEYMLKTRQNSLYYYDKVEIVQITDKIIYFKYTTQEDILEQNKTYSIPKDRSKDKFYNTEEYKGGKLRKSCRRKSCRRKNKTRKSYRRRN
jgi:hypothetical protein